VLNVCADRYRFTVGLAATLLTGKASLLPSTHTPEVIRQLAAFAPDAFCLTDDPECDIGLPLMQYPREPAPGTAAPDPQPVWPPPAIAPSQLAAYVFTSGSTGTPVPFRKTWGRLVRCVRDEALRLGFDDGRAHTLVATVPPQHMYGFESSVLVAMQSGGAFCAERPFFPADVCSALAAVPRPRALISTPVHLRALLTANVHLPTTDLIVSATAPLPEDLAREVEHRFETRLLEIYGSTETGQIATRRTAQTREWQLWPGVSLLSKEGQTWAQGGHIEQPTPLCDVIEITHGDRFLLHGRMADLVNIAGKRSSLAYLTHQLNSIPGVRDGAFFHPQESAASSTGVERVAALVVAPGLDHAAITEELRRRVDPVFLPRPLIFVDELPRNGTGKLPREALLQVAAQHTKPVH
jgi:acyl-coenzyme A synthetase/AMP-(fatty) acid ligase